MAFDNMSLRLLVRKVHNIVTECIVSTSLGSDHLFNVLWTVKSQNQSAFMNFRGIDSLSFANDLYLHLGDVDLSGGSADELLQRYDATVLML